MTSSPVELRILGHTELSTAGNLTGGNVLRQPKRLALLGYLALSASDGFRRRDQIVALFWPEKDQFHARTQLRKVFYALRGVLGADAFIMRGEEEIRLNTDVVWCDAVAFRRACEGREWTRALDLYRGDLLEGLFPAGVGQEFEAWLAEQRASLREEASRAAWECSSLADLNGQRAEAIALARRAIDLNPDDEQSVRRLIAVLDRYGDRAGALRTFGDWQERLQSEFGAEPAPETRKLARKVQSARKGESMETPSVLTPPPAHAKLTPATTVAPTISTRRTRPVGVIAAAVGVVLLLGAFVAFRRAAPDLADVAVLPFRAQGDSATALLGESIAEELTTALAQVAELGVRSTARTHEALREPVNVRDIGERLGVATLLEGSLLRDAKRIHLRARLVRVSDGRTLWARVFNVDGTDIIAAHENIAATAVREVTVILRQHRTR